MSGHFWFGEIEHLPVGVFNWDLSTEKIHQNVGDLATGLRHSERIKMKWMVDSVAGEHPTLKRPGLPHMQELPPAYLAPELAGITSRSFDR